MKNDDQFEQRLQRQPLRQVPSAWREEILAATKPNRRLAPAEAVSEDGAALVAGWRLLFARLPLAWASLAALWIVLVGVNLTLPSPVLGAAVQSPASFRLANLAALDLLSAEVDTTADPFASVLEAAPVRKPSEIPHRPRSERRRGFDFGEAGPDFRFEKIA